MPGRAGGSGAVRPGAGQAGAERAFVDIEDLADGVTLFEVRAPRLAERHRAGFLAEGATDATIVERLTSTGQVVSPGNAAEFAASIEQQKKQVAEVAKVFGNKPIQ